MQLAFVMENEDPNTVFWIERRGFRGAPGTVQQKSSDQKFASGRNNVYLQATPIEVGQILRECLWSKLECVGDDLGDSGRRRRFRVYTAAPGN